MVSLNPGEIDQQYPDQPPGAQPESDASQFQEYPVWDPYANNYMPSTIPDWWYNIAYYEGGKAITFLDEYNAGWTALTNYASERQAVQAMQRSGAFPGSRQSRDDLIGRDRNAIYDGDFGDQFVSTPFRNGLNGGRGGRGGRGGIEPVFIATDEATVRDQIRSYIVAVLGQNNQEILDSAVAEFKSKEKLAFDKRETEDIDAWQAVKAHIQATSAYKAIHQLRPDAVDEMDWVTQPQAKLQQLGISAQRAATLGIAQAQAGATNEDLIGAAKMTQVGAQGQLLKSHRDSLKNSMTAVARMIK